METYRSYIRDMLKDSEEAVSALKLSDDELPRVQTIKRWLRRAAMEECIEIRIKKRGSFLVFEQSNNARLTE